MATAHIQIVRCSVTIRALERVPKESSVIRREDNPDYSKLHDDAIEALADESGQPISVVAQVYRTQFARLESQARVPDFLLLFAMRRTREALQHSAPSDAGSDA